MSHKVWFPIAWYSMAVWLLVQAQADEHFYLRHGIYVCLLAMTAQVVTDLRRWWNS